MIDMEYLAKVLHWLTSGDMAEEWEYSPEERRYEILDFLEALMELGEAADKTATEVIFKNSFLGQLAGMDGGEGGGEAGSDDDTGAPRQ